MNVKIGLIASAAVIAAAFGFAVVKDGHHRTEGGISFPDIESVASAEVRMGGIRAAVQSPISFDMNNNMEKLTVAKIMYWLTHAEYVGPAETQFTAKGGGSSELVIQAKDGSEIEIVDAVDPVSIAVPNGGMRTGVSVSGQVTLAYDHRFLRFQAPDLKQWLESDMPQLIEQHLNEKQQP